MSSTPDQNIDIQDSAPPKHNQFALLAKKRFGPFFHTQFLGAFNDNLYKNALILLIAFQTTAAIRSDILINLAAGLFILPFFLFSATAGQIADKFEKSRLIRIIKLMEIVIMICAALALWFENAFFLMLLLFFMGSQSTFFGPVKYSIIPQHLTEAEIIGGNALVEMGTFVAILLGTMAAGILIQFSDGIIYTAIIVIVIAVAGWLCSRGIPVAAPASPNLSIDWNLFTQTFKMIGFARKEYSVFLSIMGISWFWFLGASYLTQIPNFTKQVLHGSESVVTLLLTMFSVGIGAGSLLCERLSGRKVEYGLVPIGSIGLSLFGLDLALAYQAPPSETLLGVLAFLKTSGSIRITVDFLMVGLFGGLYIVPLYALIQLRSEAAERSRVIAANNILNALFMTAAALTGAVLIGMADLSISHFFIVLTAMNMAVAFYIYYLVPEFTMRCLVWILTHIFYRIRHFNLRRLPLEGPAVIVCNHVSYVDPMIIASLCRQPVRFVMNATIFKIPVLNFIFRTAKTIPIASKTKKPQIYADAFKEIAKALDNGDIVCIFPEGKLTLNGKIDTFRRGVEKILERNPVPVFPTALSGLWGSFFSHKDAPAMTKMPRRFFSRIEYRVGEKVMPETATAAFLQDKVSELKQRSEISKYK
ncbi:MFS transporter [Desulfococcaceae bacterium HSG9]|nr:MFS transporter [Desulfococcaceae bacterium HSG9]